MLILTSWGMKEGLGRVRGGSSSALSVWSRSGADQRLLRTVGLSGSPHCILVRGGLSVFADSCLTSPVLETASIGPAPQIPSPCPGNSPKPGGSSCPGPGPVTCSLSSLLALEAFMRRPLLLCVSFGLILFLTAASTMWHESDRCPVFSLVPKGWPSVTEPFLKPRRVSDTHTSPTHSLAQDSSNSWVVRSGQQDDQPWPNTKKGYSTSTSTHT